MTKPLFTGRRCHLIECFSGTLACKLSYRSRGKDTVCIRFTVRLRYSSYRLSLVSDFVLDKLFRVYHHFKEDIFDSPSRKAPGYYARDLAPLDSRETDRASATSITSRNGSSRLERQGRSKTQEVQKGLLLGAREQEASPKDERKVAGRVGVCAPSAPLTNITSVRRQRWLQKKLSISHSGRNFPGVPILRLLSHLSRSRNPLLS